MASGNFVLDKGYNAAAALTKFFPVKFSAAETVTPVTAITDRPIGWSQFGVTAAEILKGKGSDIRLMGITEAVAGGAIAVGDVCQLEATGKVTTLVGSSGKRIVGMCVGFAATNDGDRISLFLWSGCGLA